MTTMTSRTNSAIRPSRVNHFSEFASQREARIIDNNRFGGDVEIAAMMICDEVDERSAFFPESSVLERDGYDVAMIASALDCGAIAASDLGDLISAHSVDSVQQEVLTALLRHYDGCEIDLGALREAGYDEENMASALYSGLISKPQLLLMIANQTQEDVDTAISAMLQCPAHYRWN